MQKIKHRSHSVYCCKIRYQLHVRKSKYITSNGKSVNNSLVNGILIPRNTKFAIFCNGEVIDDYEYQKRRLQGKGGYAHYFGKNRIFDSYKSAMLGKCYESMANNALNLVHFRTGKKAVNNAHAIYRNNKLYLVSKDNDILPGEEIFYSYGTQYQKIDYCA